MSHPHILTQDPERLLQGDLKELKIEIDEEPFKDGPIPQPAADKASA